MHVLDKPALHEQLVTERHKLEQAEHDLVLAKNKIKSINYDKSRLKQALQVVSDWNSLGIMHRIDIGSDGARDFYRQVAQDALDVVKKLEA